MNYKPFLYAWLLVVLAFFSALICYILYHYQTFDLFVPPETRFKSAVWDTICIVAFILVVMYRKQIMKWLKENVATDEEMDNE
jgi:uncharacterized membrane protein